MNAAFHGTQWIILGLYILTVTAIGSIFYRRRSSASQFFLGGRRMRALPIAISLVAADLSAITYMGSPAWSFQYNLELFWVTCSIWLAVPVVIYVFLPFYSRLKLYTGYEYLQRRFDLRTRLVASGLFLLMRGSHVAIAIYAPSLVLSIVTGTSLYTSVLLMGVFTTIYTTLGGMKAVIWTDVIQFSVLVSGIVGVFWLSLSRIPGGVHTVYNLAGVAGRLHFWNFSLNPHDLTAFCPAMLGGAVMWLSNMATDQAYLQRFFTAQSLRESRRAILLDALIILPVCLLLYLIGPVLYSFYHIYPSRLQGLPAPDDILPFFVIHELGGVFSGLVIASIFAASMAVMSAGINALTTATTVDFVIGWLRPQLPEKEYVRIGRWGTVGWGAACTLGALFANRLGSMVNASNAIVSLLGGPILGIFLLGVLTRRANGTASIIGGGVGLAVVSYLYCLTTISFYYSAPIGAVVTVIVGYLLSLFGPPPNIHRISGLVLGMQSFEPEGRLQPEIISPVHTIAGLR